MRVVGNSSKCKIYSMPPNGIFVVLKKLWNLLRTALSQFFQTDFPQN